MWTRFLTGKRKECLWCGAEIERALDAYRIHCRGDSEEHGIERIFVQSENESFAREIVREIVKGTRLQ
jgi:hypothetical protein